MTLAEQKAVVAHTSEAFSDTEPNVVTEAAKAVSRIPKRAAAVCRCLV